MIHFYFFIIHFQYLFPTIQFPIKTFYLSMYIFLIQFPLTIIHFSLSIFSYSFIIINFAIWIIHYTISIVYFLLFVSMWPVWTNVKHYRQFQIYDQINNFGAFWNISDPFKPFWTIGNIFHCPFQWRLEDRRPSARARKWQKDQKTEKLFLAYAYLLYITKTCDLLKKEADKPWVSRGTPNKRFWLLMISRHQH